MASKRLLRGISFRIILAVFFLVLGGLSVPGFAASESAAPTESDSQQNQAIAELRKEISDLKQVEGVSEKSADRSFLWRLSACLLALTTALFSFWALKFGIKKFEEFVSEKNAIRESAHTLRLKTLSKIFNWAGSIFIILVLVYVLLDTFGVNVAPLLAGAGIIGVALGFGSQYLIRDLINGVFILVEGQFGVNDIVKIGEFSGVVEDVNLRTTTLRDMEGRLIVIPNGEIKIVVNMTKDFAQAVLSVGVAYTENADKAMEVLSEIGKEVRSDSKFGPFILGDFEMLGIDAFSESEVTIKCRIKTLPSKQWDVSRELRRRIKNRFDELGIEMPSQRKMVYWSQDQKPVR